jgi:hypothetical protein
MPGTGISHRLSAQCGRSSTGFWSGNLGEGDHLKDPEIDERITSNWIFQKWYLGA